MINWGEISGLHVIAKLEEILAKWFGVETVYADHHAKVRSKHLDRDYSFKSHFFKIQLNTNYGHEYLTQDLENIQEGLSSFPGHGKVFDTFYPHVKAVAFKVRRDGGGLGTVLSTPLVL